MSENNKEKAAAINEVIRLATLSGEDLSPLAVKGIFYLTSAIAEELDDHEVAPGAAS